MNARILLADTTRWPEAARLGLALAQAGAEISSVCPAHGHPLMKSSVVRQPFVYSGLRPLESLATAIRRANPAFIVPCDDRAVQHLHELYAEAREEGAAGRGIADLIQRSLGAPKSHAVVSSRYGLLEIAQQENIRTPPTYPLRNYEDLAQWQQGGSFPCVLKAAGTAGGKGVRIARNPEEARQSFNELSHLFATGRVIKRILVNRDAFYVRPWWKRSRPELVVQSYIYGRPANCAVFCREGRVVAGIAVEVLCATSATEPASVVRVVEGGEMMLAADRIARRLQLSGFFGLDFIIENETQRHYLIEMNPRITPLCHLRLGGDRDMPGALWAQVSGESLPNSKPLTENDKIAYFPQAWAAESELFKSSFHDVPSEPNLVDELLHPWPDRTLLFRSFSYLNRRLDRPKQCSFVEPAASAVSRSTS